MVKNLPGQSATLKRFAALEWIAAAKPPWPAVPEQA